MSTAPERAKADPKAKVRIYRLSNRLRQKANQGGDGGADEFSLEALKAAEAEFAKMSEDYPDWVQGHIRNLYDHHGRSVDTPERTHPARTTDGSVFFWRRSSRSGCDDVMDLSLCGVAFLWESSPASEAHVKVRGGKDP